MDAMVTARVPVEIKEQGNAILREIGSSPTKLVNAAYAYLLATHSLPVPKTTIEYLGPDAEGSSQGKIVRYVTKEIREEVEKTLAAITFDVPEEFWEELGDRDYRDFIAEERLKEYEALG